MPRMWRKVENERGFTFYADDAGNEQWDHPRYPEIKQHLEGCNYVIYAPYRVALKVRSLQHDLFMNDVPLSVIIGVFEKHKLGVTESTLKLESCDLEAVLSDIYFAVKKQTNVEIDVDLATELMLNFLYNVYDRERTCNIDVSSAKIALGLFSCGHLGDLYKFLFSLCTDHNNCITRLRLQALLNKICKIIGYFEEGDHFNESLMAASLQQCFDSSPGLVGIDESTFLAWMENDPDILCWLPVLHRIQVSEKVIHSSKCSVCKVNHFAGLRYKCIKCSRYMQCQRCFFSGRVSRHHKLSHSMKEYCREDIIASRTYSISRKLSKIILCRNMDKKPANRDVKEVLSKSLKNNSCADVNASPLSELQVVIKQLETQNRELQQLLLLGARNEKDVKHYLEEHRLLVATQIEKLKQLKDRIKVSHTSKPLPAPFDTVQSTPLPVNTRSNKKREFEAMLSPIQQSGGEGEAPVHPSAMDYNGSDSPATARYSLHDVSTWIGGKPQAQEYFQERRKPTPVPTDLDDALVKLQQILANNFTLDESLGNFDNFHLKNAVTEVEGMLSSIIDSAEYNQDNRYYGLVSTA